MKRILELGDTWLRSKLKELDGVSVTYRRGTQFVSVTATRGLRQVESADESGFTLQQRTISFLIDADDLVFDGSRIWPAPGDIIELTEESQAEQFRVIENPAGNCFDFSDRSRTILRIYTTHIRTRHE